MLFIQKNNSGSNDEEISQEVLTRSGQLVWDYSLKLEWENGINYRQKQNE